MTAKIKKILKKCLEKNVERVLTHKGFINNCSLTDIESSYLHLLAVKLDSEDSVVIFDDVALTPYITSYNGEYTLAGIKFNKIILWK